MVRPVCRIMPPHGVAHYVMPLGTWMSPGSVSCMNSGVDVEQFSQTVLTALTRTCIDTLADSPFASLTLAVIRYSPADGNE